MLTTEIHRQTAAQKRRDTAREKPPPKDTPRGIKPHVRPITPRQGQERSTMTNKKRGRPMTSHQVRVIPEFRETPDIEKLAQALIGIAVSLAEKKQAEEMPSSTDAPASTDNQCEGRAA